MIKKHNYTIRAIRNPSKGLCQIETWFGLSGKPCSKLQALKIAKILEPDIEFDEVIIEIN